jgi:hypothetical protein
MAPLLTDQVSSSLVDGNDVKSSKTNSLPTETSAAPTVYTDKHLDGQYVVMVVDPDLPTSPPTEMLHWLQPFSSSSQSTTIGGKTVYELIPPSSTSAYADWKQPSPPFKVPYSHRYVILLLDLSDVSGIGDETLQADAQTRNPFDAVKTIKAAGVPIIGSTWFNVTNAEAISSGSASVSSTSSTSSHSSTSTDSSSATTTSASATSTGSGTGSATGSSATPSASGNAAADLRLDAALVVGLGALGFAILV